ncbi:MAG: endonuclease/exonuclease/phosphatase family protein [Chitinophagales bacterium]
MRRKLFLSFNALALMAYAMSLAAAFISPERCWWLAFAGLAFPILVVALMLIEIPAAIFGSKLFFVNALVLALSWPVIQKVFNISFSSSNQKKVWLTVLTYNVKNFDLYNWSGNLQTRRKIFDLLKAQHADVLCFQEFYTDPVAHPNLEYLRDSLQYPFVYFKPSYAYIYSNENEQKRPLSWGLAIFSRYPIVDSGYVTLQKNESGQCIFAGLNVGGQRLRVYNTHLHSVHLDYDDYDTLDELRETQNTQWTRVRNILRKLRRANRKRALQAEIIAAHIRRYKQPRLLCGDFNDVPVSYAAHRIGANLRDAFCDAGSGIGNTFANPIGFFRIDYVLYDPSLRAASYACIRQPLSDHYPVKVELYQKEN